MSYTPTEWNTGDVITAEKLNNIEQGIVANQSSFVVIEGKDDDEGHIYTENGYTAMTTAFNSGKMPVLKVVDYEEPNELRGYAFMNWFNGSGGIYFCGGFGQDTTTHELIQIVYYFPAGSDEGRLYN